MAGSCTVKSAGGLYLTWEPYRAAPSPVRLAPTLSTPGAFWNLGYGGFEIKVGTVGRTLCLSAVPQRNPRASSHIDVSHCTGRRLQEWTLVGTRTLGSHVEIRSIARDTMCLTAKRSARRSRRSDPVLELCSRTGRALDQTWST